MSKRRDTHRLIRWLWTSRRADAALARTALLPASVLWHAAMSARRLAYRRGWLAVHDLPLPSVAVGNLTVGGSGKTPIAGWVAQYYAVHGLTPGILLRASGGEEALVHQRAVPQAIVVADPNRLQAAQRAAAKGADVLILDDAYQRLDVHRDYNIAVVSAEASPAVRWSLPAGPWREGWSALDRADAVIVTRKRARADAAGNLARRLRETVRGPVAVAHLRLGCLEALLGGARHAMSTLASRRVVAASAIADPQAFVAQIKAAGAAVQVATWKNHHRFRDEDIAWLAHAARRADHVVITEKDAVKLRDHWPAGAPEPLVAVLELEWDEGGEAICAALDAVVVPVEQL